VQKGLEYDAPADAAILLGIIAATVGGATADVMAGERAAIFKQAHWLLGAIMLAAVIFWLLSTLVNFWVATVAAILTVGSVHAASIKFGWNSPVLPGDQSPAGDASTQQAQKS